MPKSHRRTKYGGTPKSTWVRVQVEVQMLPNRTPESVKPSQLRQFKQKVPVYDMFGNPAITKTDDSNPWWMLLDRAVKKADGKLRKPEIFPAATDARYFRQKGIPAIGFSPMANTPILLHDHNEFLNREVYLKGIKVYEAIIEAYASYEEPIGDDESLAEL